MIGANHVALDHGLLQLRPSRLSDVGSILHCTDTKALITLFKAAEVANNATLVVYPIVYHDYNHHATWVF
jgi:hypothetical protein